MVDHSFLLCLADGRSVAIEWMGVDGTIARAGAWMLWHWAEGRLGGDRPVFARQERESMQTTGDCPCAVSGRHRVTAQRLRVSRCRPGAQCASGCWR